MRTWFLVALLCLLHGQHLQGQNLQAQEQVDREAALLSFGEKVGEVQTELRLATLAAEKLSSEQQARLESLKKDVVSELALIKQEVLAQKITLTDAEKRLEKQRNYLGGWVALGQEKSKPQSAPTKLTDGLFSGRSGISTSSPLPIGAEPLQAGLFGNVPVAVTMSPEEYFAYKTLAPFLLEAQKDPEKFKEKVNAAVAEIQKKYPEGLGKALQKQQMEAIRKIKEQTKPEPILLDPNAKKKP